MDKPELKSLNKPDESRSFDKGRVDLVTVGGRVMGRSILEPGYRWSTHAKPLAGTDSCQSAHLGFAISGRVHVVMDDGTEFDVGPGEVYNVPPGHDAWVVGDEPYVSVDLGLANYAKPAAS